MAVDKNAVDYSLYLVTDRSILRGRDFFSAVEEALAAGVTLVQLREKELPGGEFYRAALRLKELCRVFKVPLIINDRLDIVLAVEADGVHIGQKDIPPNVVRGLIGPEKILGYSVSTVDQALYGQEYADYLGVGTIFPTLSKSDTGEPIGLAGLKSIKQAVKIPMVAIGGINARNIKKVKEAGADGIAVISAVLGQDNISGAVTDLLHLWREE